MRSKQKVDRIFYHLYINSLLSLLISMLYDSDDVVVYFADFNIFSDSCFDVLKNLDAGCCIHQTCHSSILDSIHSPNPSYSMNIVSRIQRKVIVDYVAEKINSSNKKD